MKTKIHKFIAIGWCPLSTATTQAQCVGDSISIRWTAAVTKQQANLYRIDLMACTAPTIYVAGWKDSLEMLVTLGMDSSQGITTLGPLQIRYQCGFNDI